MTTLRTLFYKVYFIEYKYKSKLVRLLLVRQNSLLAISWNRVKKRPHLLSFFVAGNHPDSFFGGKIGMDSGERIEKIEHYFSWFYIELGKLSGSVVGTDRIVFRFGTGSLIFFFRLSKDMVSETKLADCSVHKNATFNVNQV